MRWAAHMARGGEETRIKFLWRSLKEWDDLENLGMDGLIMLKWILNGMGEHGQDASSLEQEQVHTVKIFQVTENMRNFWLAEGLSAFQTYLVKLAI